MRKQRYGFLHGKVRGTVLVIGDPNTGGWGYTMCQRCFDYCVAQGVWSCPRPI